MSEKLISRHQVKPEDKWKLEDIYATDEAFKSSFTHMESELSKFAVYENKLTQDGQTLLAFLEAQDQFWEEMNKLYVYAHMRLHEDGNNSFYQDLSQKTEVLSIKASSHSLLLIQNFQALRVSNLKLSIRMCLSLHTTSVT